MTNLFNWQLALLHLLFKEPLNSDNFRIIFSLCNLEQESVRSSTHVLDPCLLCFLPFAREGLFKFTHVGHVAVVHPLLKKPFLDSNVLDSCQPVSNVPFLEKNLKWVVATQLQRLVDKIEHLDAFQSNFGPSFGTETTMITPPDLAPAPTFPLGDQCFLFHGRSSAKTLLQSPRVTSARFFQVPSLQHAPCPEFQKVTAGYSDSWGLRENLTELLQQNGKCQSHQGSFSLIDHGSGR